jgi:hypothetical protein
MQLSRQRVELTTCDAGFAQVTHFELFAGKIFMQFEENFHNSKVNVVATRVSAFEIVSE